MHRGFDDTNSMSNPLSIGKSVRRICLWGGPGIGKSTVAANLFAKLKVAGLNVELTQEYVKAWAYEKREFLSFDQLYIFAKQQRLEDRVLRSGVDLIVTDSPLLMQCVYGKRQGFVAWKELLTIGKMFDTHYPSMNFLLTRKYGEYQQAGRYQTKDEAEQVDREVEEFMIHYGLPFQRVANDADEIFAKLV